jgi:hypothetical protein
MFERMPENRVETILKLTFRISSEAADQIRPPPRERQVESKF